MADIISFPQSAKPKRLRSFMIIDQITGKPCAALIVGNGWTVSDANKLLQGNFGVTAIDQRSDLVKSEYVD